MDIPKITKRQTTDVLKLEGRTFKLGSYDPLMGNYILMQVMTMVLPFGVGSAINQQIGSEMLPVESNTTATKMGKKEFMELQKDILSTCFEILPAGETPVVRENGTYGIQDFTMKIAIQLLIASLAFNFRDFFADVPSNEESDQ